MKCLLSIIALLIVVERMCDASLAVEQNATAPKNPGFCFSKQYKKLIKIGQLYPIPDECGTMSCGKTYSIVYEGCIPVERYDDNNVKCTKIVQNKSLQYPDCCPYPVCEDDDNKDYDYDYYDKYEV